MWEYAQIEYECRKTKHAEDLWSGIANGRELNLELYTHRRQKLTLLHLFTDLFHKQNFPQPSE